MLDIEKYEVLPFFKNEDGCSFHRILLGFLTTGINFTHPPFENIDQALAGAKIVYFNRDPFCDLEKFLEYQDKYGFYSVCDVDDWLKLPATHILYPTWEKQRVWQRYEKLLKKMDVLTCTTERLAKKLREVNDNVFVLPNSMPFFTSTEYNEINQFGFKGYHDGPETRFIWVGGSTHYRDIKSTLSGVFRAFPTLNFSMAGYNDFHPQSKAHWDKMELLCSFNSHNPNYRRIHTKPIGNYADAFDGQDVALAPLDINEPWNGFKSSLKVYEAGVKKLACIASDCPPYRDSNADGVTYCKTSEDWKNAIKRHKDLDYAREQGLKLYEWVKKYRNLEIVNEYRFKMLNAIHEGVHAEDFETYEEFLQKRELKNDISQPE